ncbi:MAG: ABC transporter permease [Actinomycetota bacterium]|nr:ABC transporter permease [Actinomycetota bacterium]
MKALTIAGTDLRRFLRWRANLFFVFVLPMMIILLLGAAFGSNKARIGVLGGNSGRLAAQLVASLRAAPSIELSRYGRVGDLQQAVSHGTVDAGIAIPSVYDSNLASGGSVSVSYFARPDSVAQQLRATVQSVVAAQARVLAVAQLIRRSQNASFTPALARAQALARATPPVEVALRAPGGGPYTTGSSRFSGGASTQLLLFIFLNSLTGASWLIETRRLGIARRVLSTPTRPATLIAGQLLGRLAIALFQALIIVLGSLLLFGVHWGDPLGTAAVILSFSLAATGAAMLLGSMFSSEQQSAPVALLLGLGLAALGGSMAPLEVFPKTARLIAHVTPHAWANEAFSKLLQHGRGLVSVLPDVGVLFGFALVAITAAIWQLRRAITQ